MTLETSFDASDSALAKKLNLSNGEVKSSRIKRKVNSIYSAATNAMSALKQEIDTLEAKKEELMDMSPNSTTSLKVGKDDFNAEEFWAEISQLNYDIEVAKLKFKVNAEVYNEWFADKSE